MPSLSEFFLLFIASCIVLWGCELLYFKVAGKYNIIDKPNQRSSHVVPTIRGGGVIFVVAIILWYFYDGGAFPYMLIGSVIIAVISFIDDIREQPPLVRFSLQFVSLLLLLLQVNFFEQPWWLWTMAMIVVVGTVNAFNFMDGINGITGMYALANLATFFIIEACVIHYTSVTMIIVLLASIVVFLFYNFRKRARCFAGDVGSIVLAYVQIFLLLQLIQHTQYYGWVLFFLVFGVDSIVTIIFRLKRKENIFKPHRTHLYQYLVNEMDYPHRTISVIYSLVQVVINAAVIYIYAEFHNMIGVVALGIVYTMVYLILRIRIVQRLAGAQNI